MTEPAANTSPLLRPPPELIRSTRLSIADLLLITLGTAIAIWILQPPSSSRDVPFVIANVTMSPLYGAAVASLFLAMWRCATGLDPFALEPGHWLLLIIGTMFTGIGLTVRMIPPNVVMPEYQPLVAYFVAIVILGICLACFSIALIIAAFYANEHQPLRWRLVFRLIGWTLLLGVISSLFLPAGGFFDLALPLAMLTSPVLLLLTTLAAVAIDLWERTYRDHWHWLGVAAFLGLPVHFGLLILADQFT